MFVKFFGYPSSKFIKKWLIVFLKQRAQYIHIIFDPKFSDGLFAGPGMTFETCLSKEILIRSFQARVKFVDMNMKAKLSADFLTYLGRRWVWVQESKTRVKKDCANRLRLLQGHALVFLISGNL